LFPAFLYTFRALQSHITTVILDFGGVLGLPQDPERAATMASLCGLPMEKFRLLYERDRLELDRGTLAAPDYWGRILQEAGVTPSPELIERIEREDALGWMRVNQRVVDWSGELRGAGYRTAILSNMPTDKLSFMRASGRMGWIGDFEAAIFSCDVGLVKPEPAIYRLCLEKLKAVPGECVFLDDYPVNVEGARAAGINALLFRSAEEAAAELQRRWRLPVQRLVDGAHA
jgi:putative hydrolase of the HAD superfamily